LDLLQVDDVCVRPLSTEPYDELLLVGHSLGGLVLRRALSDLAQNWIEGQDSDREARRPALLDAKLRLFSPASAGFRSAGWLGLLQASAFWPALNMYLRRSSAYTDLQPKSEVLTNTRQRTERLVSNHRRELTALQASILWANPDDVVLAERYDSDPVDDSADGASHTTVCKPSDTYETPWPFVEHGVDRE
jgi:pimeloyl-ACP methyl ester carboxylesterase